MMKTLPITKVLTLVAALVLLLVPTGLPRWMDAPPPPARRAASRMADETLTVVRGVVLRNETLASAMGGLLSPAAVHRLVETARPVYDLARISAGRPFGITLGADGLLTVFTYGIDELRTLRVVRHGEDLEA